MWWSMTTVLTWVDKETRVDRYGSSKDTDSMNVGVFDSDRPSEFPRLVRKFKSTPSQRSPSPLRRLDLGREIHPSYLPVLISPSPESLRVRTTTIGVRHSSHRSLSHGFQVYYTPSTPILRNV